MWGQNVKINALYKQLDGMTQKIVKTVFDY